MYTSFESKLAAVCELCSLVGTYVKYLGVRVALFAILGKEIGQKRECKIMRCLIYRPRTLKICPLFGPVAN